MRVIRYAVNLCTPLLAIWLATAAPAALAQQAATGVKAPSIDALIEPLRQKLRDNPDDVGNWVLLAQSYDYLGRYAEARDALAHAEALGYVPSEPLPGAAAAPTPAPARPHRGPSADPVLMQWMAEKMEEPLPEAGK